MGWNEINKFEYQSIFDRSWTVFHSVDFNELNKNKVDSLHYFHYKNEHADFGIIFGERNGKIYSPFSSPFGGVEMKGNAEITELEKMVRLLSTKIKEQFSFVCIIFPPTVYGQEWIEQLTNSFLNSGFKKLYTDTNFHLALSNNTDPEINMERNAKKNLRKGLLTSHNFFEAQSEDERLRAYSVIQRNRTEKTYPLKMTYEDLLSTSKSVHIDFYILTFDELDAAAAVVFRVSPKIAMVVYWGHLNAFSDFRPINLLAYYLQKKYTALGFETLDIGPSSENGIMNEGLGAFKDSLGCIRTQKITLTMTHE